MIDIVFSLDSVITAVGLVDEAAIMIIAILLAVALMMFAATAVSRFVEERPSIKRLALAFLVLIGAALIAEGWGLHIPKGYIYFAMAFAVGRGDAQHARGGNGPRGSGAPDGANTR